MNNLQKVFNRFSDLNKDVLILLDETFCFSKDLDAVNKKTINITSISEQYDIIESLREEGSAIINYKISNKGNSKQNNKILNSLISIFIEFNFEPYILTLINNEVIVSVVISDNDIDFIDEFDENSDNPEDEDEVKKDDDDEDEVEDEYVNEKVKEDEDVKENVKEDDDEDEDVKNEDEDEDEEVNEDVNEDSKEDEDEDEDEDEVKKEEEDDDDDDDESVNSFDSKKNDPIKIKINEIKMKIQNFEKLKKTEIIEYLREFNIKNIKGIYVHSCSKKELSNHLAEILKN